MRITVLIIALLLCTELPAQAWQVRRSGMEGTVQLEYVDYASEEGGVDAGNGQHFLQQYTLLYTNEGYFNGGRGGLYRINLGYEFNVLDSTINDESHNTTTGKVLFRGNVSLAPGGLPLRLNLFSEDMSRSTFMKSTALRRPVTNPNSYIGESIFDPALVDDLANGSRVMTGFTIMAGIRNGSYLGQYREVLSTLPRLLIDFKQYDVDDDNTWIPEKWRQRDLAFISLNKKDNWFHLRLRDYTDFYQSERNFTERSITLGSVDQVRQRQWINLTNWIKLSGDLNYGKVMPSVSTLGDTETFDINLFALTNRARWQSSSLVTYQRERNDFWLVKELNVPFYATGEPSADARWHGRLEFERVASVSLQPSMQSVYAFNERDSSDYYGATRVTTGRRLARTVTWNADLEHRGGDDGSGNGIRLGTELASNPAQSSDTTYALGFSSALAQGKGALTEKSGTYTEQVLTVRYDTRRGPHLRTGFSEKLVFGSGEMESGVVRRIPFNSMNGIRTRRDSATSRSGTVLHSMFEWFGEAQWGEGWENRLNIAYDWLQTENGTSNALVVSDALRLQRNALTLALNGAVVLGDSQGGGSGSLPLNTIQTTPTDGNSDLQWQLLALANYQPSRHWDAGAEVGNDTIKYNNGTQDSRTSFAQTSNFYVYTVNGLVRRMLTFGEEFLYERFESPLKTWQTWSLTGKTEWNPKANLNFGAHVRYRYYSPEGSEQLTLMTKAEANYRKLTFGLYYSIGNRTPGKGYAERNEQRIEVKLRKIF